MPIEILILSGVRQGDRLQWQASKLEIGDRLQADLYIDPANEPTARGHAISIWQEEEGWRIKPNLPGVMLVNQSHLYDTTPLRSGDVVRMSEEGPDFRFTIVRQLTSNVELIARSNSSPPSFGIALKDPVRKGQLEGEPDVASSQLISSRTESVPRSAATTVMTPADTEKPWPIEPPDYHRSHVRDLPIAKAHQNRWRALQGLAGCVLLLLCLTLGWLAINRREIARPAPLPCVELRDHVIAEQSMLAFSVKLENPNQELGILNYQLELLPAGPDRPASSSLTLDAKLDPQDGLFTWTPSEADGPGKYRFRVGVTSSLASWLPVQREFSVLVTESNQPPAMVQLPDQMAYEGEPLTLYLPARDLDEPRQQLRYELVHGPIELIQFDATQGVLRFTPAPELAGKSIPIVVRVQDSATPAAADEQSFNIVVKSLTAWERIARQASSAVALLVVDHPDGRGTWPIGTAAAIEPDVLITSAVVATEADRFRRQGWKISVRQESLKEPIPVQEVLLYKGFVDLEGKPQEQIYFDMAMIRIAQPLSQVIPISARSSLELAEGARLGCLGISFDTQHLTRFSPIRPLLAQVDLLARIPLAEEPGAPLLLLVRGTLAPRLYGSPILNEHGELVALYAEKADLPAEAKPQGNEHYAPSLELARLWLRKEGRKYWVPPPIKLDNAVPTPGRS